MLEDIEASHDELTFFFRTTVRRSTRAASTDAHRRADNMCQQEQTRDWFSRGATFDYRITDSNDEEYRFSYDSCPAAAAS